MSEHATHERDSTAKDREGFPEQSTQNREDQRRGADPARPVDPDPRDETPAQEE